MFNNATHCPSCKAALPGPGKDCSRCGFNWAAAAAAQAAGAGPVGVYAPQQRAFAGDPAVAPARPAGVPPHVAIPPGFAQYPRTEMPWGPPQGFGGAPQGFSMTPPPPEQSDPYQLWLDTIGGLLTRVVTELVRINSVMTSIALATPGVKQPTREPVDTAIGTVAAPDAILTPVK